MASFQAKIGWKWLRKRENKNYRSVTQVGKGRESEKIKIIVPFRFVPTRQVREHSKKIAKKFKKLKNTIMASFQAKICWRRLKKRENKNYRYVTFLPDP